MGSNLLYFGDNLKVLREHVADLTYKKAKKEEKKTDWSEAETAIRWQTRRSWMGRR